MVFSRCCQLFSIQCFYADGRGMSDPAVVESRGEITADRGVILPLIKPTLPAAVISIYLLIQFGVEIEGRGTEVKGDSE